MLSSLDLAVRDACAKHLRLVSSSITLVPIDEGENRAWFVNGDLVFRLSLVPDPSKISGPTIDTVVRRLLHQSMSEPMASLIPCSVYQGSLRGIGPYTIDRRIHGTSLEHAVPNDRTESDLVMFFRQLQSVSVEDAMAMGVPLHDNPNLHSRTGSWDAMDRLQTQDQLPRGLTPPTQTEWVCSSSAPPQGPIVLSHSDLKGEHILIRLDGSLAGIIDWADSTISGPADDIAGLSISVGAAMAARIGLAMGLTGELVRYGLWKARHEATLRLDERLNGTDRDSPLALLEMQMARAFEMFESVSDASPR